MKTRGNKKVICETCCNEFVTYNSNKGRFCSRSCYDKQHKTKPKTCLHCNKDFILPGQPYQKYCSRECYTNDYEAWNKGLTNAQPKLLGEYHPGIKKRMKILGVDWDGYNNWKQSKKRYWSEVWRITNQQPIEILPNSDKLRGKSGIPGAFQLDHIISISEGFENKISPDIIGSINNLQFLPWEENLKKRNKKIL